MLAPRDNHLDKAWSIVFQLLHGRLTLDDIAKQIADASVPALQARVDALLRQVTFHKEQDNEARLKRLIGALAHDDRGSDRLRAIPAARRHRARRHRVHGAPHVRAVARSERSRDGAHARGLRERAAERRCARARAARDRAPRRAAHARGGGRFVRDRDPQLAQGDAAHAARRDRRGRGALPARLPSPQAAAHHGRDLGRLRPRRPHRHRLEQELELPLSARARGARGARREPARHARAPCGSLAA